MVIFFLIFFVHLLSLFLLSFSTRSDHSSDCHGRRMESATSLLTATSTPWPMIRLSWLSATAGQRGSRRTRYGTFWKPSKNGELQWARKLVVIWRNPASVSIGIRFATLVWTSHISTNCMPDSIWRKHTTTQLLLMPNVSLHVCIYMHAGSLLCLSSVTGSLKQQITRVDPTPRSTMSSIPRASHKCHPF